MLQNLVIGISDLFNVAQSTSMDSCKAYEDYEVGSCEELKKYQSLYQCQSLQDLEAALVLNNFLAYKYMCMYKTTKQSWENKLKEHKSHKSSCKSQKIITKVWNLIS